MGSKFAGGGVGLAAHFSRNKLPGPVEEVCAVRSHYCPAMNLGQYTFISSTLS